MFSSCPPAPEVPSCARIPKALMSSPPVTLELMSTSSSQCPAAGAPVTEISISSNAIHSPPPPRAFEARKRTSVWLEIQGVMS